MSEHLRRRVLGVAVLAIAGLGLAIGLSQLSSWAAGGPTVTSVSTSPLTTPPQGPTAGGTTVIVNGSGFNPPPPVTGGSNSQQVNFVGCNSIVMATPTTVSDTQLTVTAPAHAACVVDVTVTVTTTSRLGTTSNTSSINTGGCPNSTPCDQFTYVAPTPQVTNAVPNVGPAGGGQSIAVMGSGLSFATAVDFVSRTQTYQVTQFTNNTDGEVDLQTPTIAPISGDVVTD